MGLEKIYYNELVTIFSQKSTLVNQCENMVNLLYKNDEEHLTHLYNVAAMQVCTIDKSAALLHDCLNIIDIETLELLEIPHEVIEIIKLLEKKDDITEDMLTSLIIKSGNRGALNVRYADLLDQNYTYDDSSMIRLRRFFDIY